MVAEYEYDPYGNIVSQSGPLADVNPLRYRGYVYDNESKLYYLQSRYYDPEIGRFINADAYVSTGQGILGNNMFAYCLGNPVSRTDTQGYISYSEIEDQHNDDNPLNDIAHMGNTGNTSQQNGRGFSTFKALKQFLGSPGDNNHWHHIVEQCQTEKSGFSSEQINNTSNVIAVDANTHAKITGYYNTTTFPFTNGLSVRNWLSGQPYAVQFDFGMSVLQKFGVLR